MKTTERGYGSSHQANRKRWAPSVAAGGVGPSTVAPDDGLLTAADIADMFFTMTRRGRPASLGHRGWGGKEQ
jgi:hypothetical protein